jgi:hypothetical protein
MFSEYYRVLSWSEQEYNNVIQAYYSRYSKVAMKMKPFPWKYLFKIFNVSELELVH